MYRRRPVRTARGERGQAIVEYAIVFPIQILLTLCMIQLAYLFVAKQVVSYAAFCAARAALVYEDDDRFSAGDEARAAAALACARIAGSAGVEAGSVHLPGWGDLRGYNAALVKTDVRILSTGDDDEDDSGPQPPPVRVEIIHDYQLRVPIADEITYHIGDVLVSFEGLDRTWGAPHIPIRGTCTLARPWPRN